VHLGEELIADGVRAIVGLVFESAGPGGISGLLDRICREAPDEDARREAARLEYKRIRLTDAFLSGEIDETAYRLLKNRCEKRLARLCERNASPVCGPAGATPEIARLSELLMSGRGEDPDFYLGLVSGIAVFQPDALDVVLCGDGLAWSVFFNNKKI
jgi:hypothetical protein